jgi:hypothetical protein
LVAGIVLSASAFARAGAQTSAPLAPYRARLLGVFNAQTGDPIEGAEVLDVLNKTKALTTATGTVTLAFLPDGGSMVRVQKIGFSPYTNVVAISVADTVPFTVMLTPLAQALPTVVTKDTASPFISPGLRAFAERARAGNGGRFISEAELRKNETKNMTYMIRRLPGIQIDCPRRGMRVGQCWAYAGRAASKFAIAGGQCAIDLYIDGQISGDNDLEKLRADQFAGVEWYAGAASIPAQYNKTGSTCGVLLFWTRDR